MKLLLTLAIFALSALTDASPFKRETPAFKVSLSAKESTTITAAITNAGSEDVSVLKIGSLLSDAPIQKLSLADTNGNLFEFQGIKLRYALDSLTVADYQPITAGQTITRDIDLAEVYDLTKASEIKNFIVSASGVFQYTASAPITPLSGEATVIEAVEFNATPLEIEIASTNKETIAKHLERRVVLSSCSGSRQTATQNALSTTRSRASAAASAASSGSSAKFNEFFRTTSSSARSTVAARFRAVSSAASVGSGSVRYYCTDPMGYCESNILAWTLPSQNIIANCDIYYTRIPASTSSCHAQDQWTTTLHELTHAPGVYSPGTDDYAYGYSASIALSSSRAVLNADNYALYAQAIALGC